MSYDRTAWQLARAERRKAEERRRQPVVGHSTFRTVTGTMTIPLRTGELCLWSWSGAEFVPTIQKVK